MAELIITYSNGKTTRHSLTLKPQDVGRDPACHICIEDPSVSRRHADILGDAQGRFTIRDLGAKNSTLVNDVPITTYQLNDGDRITFGTVFVRFHAEDSTALTASITLDDRAAADSQSVSFASRAHKLRLSEQRLQLIYEISDRLTALRDRQDLLHDIMKICIDMFEFERGAIALKQPGGRGLDWPVVHNLRGVEGEIKISRTILKQALEDGERAVFTETAQSTMDPTVSMVQHGTRSAMCVPIAYSDEILGVIYGDRISTTRDYDQEDVDFLAALARQLSIGLTNARLLEDEQQKIYLEGEIAVARQIQSGLFPETLEVHPALEIAAINDPGRQVSGDYYDVIPLTEGRVGLIIADVTGKGVASALLSANLQAAARLLFPGTDDLALLANRLNRLVYHNTDTSRFITALLTILDPRQQRLTYISAGHHYPLRIGSSGEVETLPGESNLPFGISEECSYESLQIDWEDKGAVLFFYTDGLTEAMDEDEKEYGAERLVQTLEQNAQCDPAGLLKKVRRSVESFSGDVPQSDDITMIAVRPRK